MRRFLKLLKEFEEMLEKVEGQRFQVELVILQKDDGERLLGIELLDTEDMAERLFDKAMKYGILKGMGSYEVYRVAEEPEELYSFKRENQEV